MWYGQNCKVAEACLCFTNFPILTFNVPFQSGSTHPAAIVKINNSSLLGASISSWPFTDVIWPRRSLHSSAASLCSRILSDCVLSEEPTAPTTYFMTHYQCVTPLNALLFKSFLKRAQNPKESPGSYIILCWSGYQHVLGPSLCSHSICQPIDKLWVQVNEKPGSYLKRSYCFQKGWDWKTSSLSTKYHDAPWKFVYILFFLKT